MLLAMKSATGVAEQLAKFQKEQEVETIEENLKKTIVAAGKLTAYMDAFKKLKKDEPSLRSEYETLVKKELKVLNQPDYVSQDPNYTTFKDAIWKAAHPGEAMPGQGDDLMVESQIVIPTKCPITSMEMTDPVKTPCGHFFDRHGIVDWIQKETRKMAANAARGRRQPAVVEVRCPTAGCNRKFTEADLVEAEEVRVEQEAKRRRGNRSQPTNSSREDATMVEDSDEDEEPL